MAEYMQRIAAMGNELTVEERNLLSVAFKNVIGLKRSSWRILASEEEKLKDKPDDVRYKCNLEYKNKVIVITCTIVPWILYTVDSVYMLR